MKGANGMHKTFDKYLEKVVRYIHRTYKNKLVALALFIIGMLSMTVDNDGTAFIFTLFLAIPLFFARTNWIGQH